MSQVDQVALVMVKSMWHAFGETPLIVQLALTAEARDEAWEHEARRLVEENRRRGHYQLPRVSIAEFCSNSPVPAVWDEHFVGEVPGMDDPILSKEIVYRKCFHGSGEQNTRLQIIRGPSTS